MEYLEPILKLLFPFILGAGTLYFTFYKWKEDKKAKEHKEEVERLEKKAELDKLILKQDTDRKIANLEEQRKAHAFNQNLLSNILKLKHFSRLDEIKSRIFNETKATRFIIFVAINGKTEPNKVFALYGDKETNHQIEKQFKAVEIDDVYRSMLKIFERDKTMSIDVLRMPKGMLKSIYYNETISYVLGLFINRFNLDEDNDAIVYASVGTDNEYDFTDIEKNILEIIRTSEVIPLIDKIVE